MAIEKSHTDALNQLAEHVYGVAASKGFHDDDMVDHDNALQAARLGSAHLEVSQLWERHRKGTLDTDEKLEVEVPLKEWAKNLVLASEDSDTFDTLDNGKPNSLSYSSAYRYATNLHGEVSELYEAIQSRTLYQPCDKAKKMEDAGLEPLTCAEEELADVIIRALDTAKAMGIDIGRAVQVKSAFNETRPFRHGGKKA